MIQPKNETKDLLLSKTKDCKTFIKQTHRKAEEILEFNVTKPRESFSFKPSLNFGPDFNWMVGLTSLEVYIFNFNMREDKNIFELYNFLDSMSGGVSY